jgi:hypothetical protein
MALLHHVTFGVELLDALEIPHFRTMPYRLQLYSMLE